mgnify:CR=1 FL=1
MRRNGWHILRDGPALTLAGQAEANAEPGTVLVSEHTYCLATPLFEWQALGEIAAQGVRQPLAVYRPLAHKVATGKGRGIEGLSSPLVGRDVEFKTLQEATDRLRSGVGGIVTLVALTFKDGTGAGPMRDKLAAKLADPALYESGDAGAIATWQKKYAEVMDGLDRAEDLWMAALEKLEAAEAL